MKQKTLGFRLKTLDILKVVENLGAASKLDRKAYFSNKLDKIFEILVRRIYQEADEWGGIKNADQDSRTHRSS
jgi:hypothetical protein